MSPAFLAKRFARARVNARLVNLHVKRIRPKTVSCGIQFFSLFIVLVLNRVADTVGVGPDPDLTLEEKNPDHIS